MNTVSTLNTLHILALVLLLGSALVLAVLAWRARQQAAANPWAATLQRPAVLLWALMALCLLGLPFSGWWLVHLVGWPLGQAWVLASSLLYTLGALAWAWLLARLLRLRGEDRGAGRLGLGLALVSAACFVAIAVLTVLKPV